MRQAGRSLPEYRALRAGTAMLEACQDPDLVTEITLQPVRRYGVDAAILFSDIVLPLMAVGVDLDIKPGVGPVVAHAGAHAWPTSTRCPDLEPEHARRSCTTAVRRLVAELGPTPLIGFAGAPFTLATYLIEGGPSKEHARTKAMMYGEPEALGARCWTGSPVSAATFLRVAGRRRRLGGPAVRLVGRGAVAPPTTRARCCRTRARCFDGAGGGRDVPRIHFGVGTGELLPLIGDAGADVVGVDWRVPLDEARPPGRPGRVAAGQPRPGRPARRPGRRSTARCAGSSSRAGPPAGTSSTSATACCPTPTPACSPTSSTWCTS